MGSKNSLFNLFKMLRRFRVALFISMHIVTMDTNCAYEGKNDQDYCVQVRQGDQERQDRGDYQDLLGVQDRQRGQDRQDDQEFTSGQDAQDKQDIQLMGSGVSEQMSKKKAQELLFNALRVGYVNGVKKALACGADVAQTTSQGDLPLGLALYTALNSESATEVLSLVIEAKADVNKMFKHNPYKSIEPKYDDNPLNLLIVSGSVQSPKLLEILLKAGASIEYGYDGSLPTPFHYLSEIRYDYENIERACNQVICGEIKPAIVTVLCKELEKRAQAKAEFLLSPTMLATSVARVISELDLCGIPVEIWQSHIVTHLNGQDLGAFSRASKAALVIGARQRANLAKKRYALTILNCRNKAGRRARQEVRYALDALESYWCEGKDEPADEQTQKIFMARSVLDTLNALQAQYEAIPGRVVFSEIDLSTAKSLRSQDYILKTQSWQKRRAESAKRYNQGRKDCLVS